MTQGHLFPVGERRLSFVWPLLAAAIARVAMLPFAHIENPVLWEYGDIARHMIAGKGYSLTWVLPMFPPIVLPSAFMPPGETLLQYALLSVFGDGLLAYIAIFLVQVACGVAFVYVIGRLLRVLFGSRRLQLIAMWSVALYPSFLYATTTFGVASEILLLNSLFILLACNLHEALINGNGVTAATVLFGVCAGILSLFRSEAPLPIIAVLLLLLASRRIPIRRRVSAAIVAAAIATAIIAPWTIRNYGLFHTLIPGSTSGGFNLWKGNHTAASGSAWNSAGVQYGPPFQLWIEALGKGPTDPMFELHFSQVLATRAEDWMSTHPIEAIALAGKKAVMLWSFDWYNTLSSTLTYATLSLVTLGLAMFGLFRYRSLRQSNTFGVKVIVLLSGVYTVLAMVFFVVPRYQIFLVGIYWPFVVLGIDGVLLNVTAQRRVRTTSQESIANTPQMAESLS